MSPRTGDASPTARCTVSVIIKAFNERAGISRAVDSALAAVAMVGGEVVLADSASTDGTPQEAARFPIRIVQLAHPDERCCGIGPQIGYAYAKGEYVYLMDGDMVLEPGFLPRALAFLAQHPEVAGVGGRVVERHLESLEFRERHERAQRSEAHRAPGPVDRLDGGGLYRRVAIEEVGYLSDRNLHSYEEFDLAVRLRARGWRLWRLPCDAVAHQGHQAPALRLLWRRWTSGYACGIGELVRAAAGRPWWRLVLRDLRELRLYAAVWGWWITLGLVLLAAAWDARAVPPFGALLLLPWLVVSLRKRSLARGTYAVAAWCVHAAGLARGVCRTRRDPQAPIAVRILREPRGSSALATRRAPGGLPPQRPPSSYPS
jgi:GT2 family glycosyltransferase